MRAASDEQILARALQEDRTVVSADSDFGVILAAQDADRPSFILFRDPNLLVAHDYAGMLIPSLALLEPEPVASIIKVIPARISPGKCFINSASLWISGSHSAPLAIMNST